MDQSVSAQQNMSDINSTIIKKSDLKPANLNSIGIIASEITGVDQNIWIDLNEDVLAKSLRTLSYQNLYSSGILLKRILISELNPPKSSKNSQYSGQLYFLTKLDILLAMGALEEVEALIFQTPKMNKEIFSRWTKVSLLKGQLTPMCKKLIDNPQLSNDLSLRVICLARLNDWDAAALILSSGAALGLIDEYRELLLISYLDPLLIKDESSLEPTKSFEEIDFYIRATNNLPSVNPNNEPKYNFRDLDADTNNLKKILATESLVMSKAINGSTLFELYRDTRIEGENEVSEIA